MNDQTSTENHPDQRVELERLVMPDFTSSEWEKFADTPAHGEVFYNAQKDQTAIRYSDCVKLYYNRIVGKKDNWAINFKDCKYFEA